MRSENLVAPYLAVPISMDWIFLALIMFSWKILNRRSSSGRTKFEMNVQYQEFVRRCCSKFRTPGYLLQQIPSHFFMSNCKLLSCIMCIYYQTLFLYTLYDDDNIEFFYSFSRFPYSKSFWDTILFPSNILYQIQA